MLSTALKISLIKRIKISGLQTQPWKTPLVDRTSFDLVHLSILTEKVLLLYMLFSKRNIFAETPTFASTAKIPCLGIKSNAFLKSTRHKYSWPRFLCNCSATSVSKMRALSTVCRFRRKPDCASFKRFSSSAHVLILSDMILLKHFPIWLSSPIPRYESGSLTCPFFLYIEHSSALDHCGG